MLFALSATVVMAEECNFNIEAINKKYFVDDTNFSMDAQWDDEKKIAIIDAGKGKQIKVKYSACTHLVMHAEYIIPKDGTVDWLKEITWFANELFVYEEDKEVILVQIAKESFKQKLAKFPGTLVKEYIPTDFYSLMELKVIDDKKNFIISFYWYD